MINQSSSGPWLGVLVFEGDADFCSRTHGFKPSLVSLAGAYTRPLFGLNFAPFEVIAGKFQWLSDKKRLRLS